MAGRRKPHTPDLHPTEVHLWFRAKDALAPVALSIYADLNRAAAAGLEAAGDIEAAERQRDFAADVDVQVEVFRRWQAEHPDLVGLPD